MTVQPFSATAPVKALRGSATDPSVTFTGDGDTGLYSSGDNELSVTTGGSQKAKFDANGLEVSGDINLDDGGTFATTLQLITPTANRTISFPDATGTVGLVAGSSGQLVYNNAGAYAGAPSTSVGATGNITLNLAGAASTPPVSLTGTWFSGGTATTTKPQLLIEPVGTTSTAWSTDGTGLGVNAASGFAGRLFDFQVNGSSKAVLTGAGLLGVGTASPSAQLDVAGQAIINDSGSAYFSAGLTVGNDIAVRSPDSDPSRLLLVSNTDHAVATIEANGDNSAGYVAFGTRQSGSTDERARIDSSGRLLVGTSSARSNFFNTSTFSPGLQLEGTIDQNRLVSIVGSNSAGAGGVLILASQKSGTVGGNTIVSNNGQLGVVSFQGNDGTEFIEAARIQAEVDGTPGANNMPGRLVFSTTADGASSPTEQLRITSDSYIRLASGSGGIQFNGDTAAANALNDYEEGTWSMALTGVTGSSSGGSVYVKVGNLVHLKFSRTSTGAQTFTAGDPVEITGWPFSAAQKAGNTATIFVNVANQNNSWAAVNQGIKMFNMVFEPGGNTARLYNMSTGAVVTYGDLYLNPTSTNPAIRGYVTVNVA